MDNLEEKTGFILIDKPVDWTSHDVIGYLRKVLGIKKVGHAGTLDPFATGLLIVGIGRSATKRLDEFKNMPKEYITTIKLGYTSDTLDSTGAITEANPERISEITSGRIAEVVHSLLGKSQQTPPMYSAKKVKGKKLYELARRGQVIERAPIDIEVYDIELLPADSGEISLRLAVSPGTYIRVIAEDIGSMLGTGAYCLSLRRTAIGEYRVSDALPPREVEGDHYMNLFI
jgi:tRNA pseudouridine55 synthase